MEPTLEDKPLYIQVAEALGWTYIEPEMSQAEWGWQAPEWWLLLRDKNEGLPEPMRGNPPYFDTDWSAIGPLIEKLPLTIGKYREEFFGGLWYAISPGLIGEPVAQMERTGPTPLIAVCNLILTLAEAGKLKAA